MKYFQTNSFKSKTYQLGTLLVAFLIVIYFFRPVIGNLNTVMFSKDGDGYRAYYVALYQVQNSSELARTECMNYPLGENMYYLDSQPLIVNLIQILKPVINLSGYTVGIINFMMLLGIVLAAYFLYLLMRHFNAPRFWSSLSALGICFLSPNLIRIGGHFSLSYLFIIPLLLLLALRFFKAGDKKYGFLLILLGVFSTATHFYWFGFYFTLIAGLWGLHFLKHHENRNWLNVLRMLVQLLTPVLAVNFIMLFGGDAPDRPSYPWGFFYFRAYPESVFLPIHKPYLRFVTELFGNPKYINWEGISYVGTVSSLITIGLFFYLIGSFFKRRERRGGHPWLADKELGRVTLVSGILLLYSFGMPFVLGMESWADKIGIIRQMRSIARFSWLFFYVCNIGAFVLLWRWFNKKRRPWQIFVLALAILVLYREAYFNVKDRGGYVNNSNSRLLDHKNSQEGNKVYNRLGKVSFQSIYPLPYHYSVCEYIDSGEDYDLAHESLLASLKLGIPTRGLKGARSSVSQALDQWQFQYRPTQRPQLLNDYDQSKDVLILHKREATVTMTDETLISNAEKIDSSGMFDYYRIKASRMVEVYDSLAYVNHSFFYGQQFEENMAKDSLYYIPLSAELVMQDLPNASEIFKAMVDTDSAMYVLEFELEDAQQDLYMNSMLNFKLASANGEVVFDTKAARLDHLKYSISNRKVIFHLPVRLNKGEHSVEASFYQPRMLKGTFTIKRMALRKMDA